MPLFLTTAATTSTSLVATLDWSKPTWDLFIVLFFIVAAFLYGISLGRDRIIVILVSIYMALAVVNSVPYLSDTTTEVGIERLFVLRISIFVGVFIALFVLLSQSALRKTIASSDKSGRWWQIFVFSILHVGLLITLILSFLPPDFPDQLAPLTRTIFATDLARFIWIVLPIITMILLRGGASDDKKFKYDI